MRISIRVFDENILDVERLQRLNQLLDWTRTQYDQTGALSGYATVSRTVGGDRGPEEEDSTHYRGEKRPQ